MSDPYNVSVNSITNSSDKLKDLQTPQLLWILLTIYLGVVVLLGFLGNLVVLYGSLIYKDLKLDPASLLFVHSMSVSDICCVFLFFLPMLTTAIFQRWVLGQFLCWVVGFFKSACVVNEFLTVLAMSGGL